MKADFSRFTHDATRHYTAVLKQQGRVDLDADTNEAALIEDHLDRTRLLDILCGCAFPRHASGFDVTFIQTEGQPDLELAVGRAYVGGRLCEVHATENGQPCTYLTQPFYPAPPALDPVEGRRDLVYLDVWQRHVTALEDPHIREVALGGPDTATRLQTVWQVKVAQDVPRTAQCCDCPRLPGLEARGRLSARLTPVPPSDDPCVIGPGAGYRGLENRLYRVEIHDEGEALNAAAPTALAITSDAATTSVQFTADGWRFYPTPWRHGQLIALAGTVAGETVEVLARVTALDLAQRRLSFAAGNETLNNLLATGSATARRVKTFKWSRDNGSVAFAIESFEASDQIIARRIRHDRVLALDLDQVVEIAGTETDLHGGPGTLATITDLDRAERRVTLDTDVSRHSGESQPKIRRWDQPPSSTEFTVIDGAIVVETGRVYELEDGIEVEFYDGPSVSGDYWTFAARAAASAGGSTLEGFETAAPAGIDHDYCCLALIAWTAQLEDRFFKVDCRPEFPCLTDLDDDHGCCIDVHPGEDLRTAIATAVAAGGGRVCLCAGVHNLRGPLPLEGIQNLTLTGQGPSTVLQLHGIEGRGGILIEASRRIRIEHMILLGNDVTSLVSVFSRFATPDREQPAAGPAHTAVLHELQMINLDPAPRPPGTTELPPRDITGVVTSDDDCRPFAGVRVFVQGTLHSAITNDEGRYQISARPNEVLVYYAPGYAAATIAVLDQSAIDIVLHPHAEPAIANPFRCAVRLADTHDIRIEHCRMLSEVGVLALWGPALPPVPQPGDVSPPDDDTGPANVETVATFDEIQPNTTFPTGSSLIDPGSGLIFAIEGEPDRSATILDQGPPRRSVLLLNGVSARLNLVQPVQQLSFRYGYFGGSITIEINGTVRTVDTVMALNGQTLAGVRLTVTPDPGATPSLGQIGLTALDSPITAFAIGGQEFWIDDVRLLRRTVPEQPPIPREPVRYGSGAATVHLHDVRIRYRDYGVLALRADQWHVDDSDLRPLPFPGSVPPDNPDALAAALDFLAGATPTAYLERVAGTAIKSCIWRDSTLERSHLEGAIGFEAGLCLRGAIAACTCDAVRRGLSALWIHAADWHHNRITCLSGPGLSFAGNYQTRLTHNWISAAIGCLRLPWQDTLLRIHGCAESALRGYGQPGTSEREQLLLWIFLEDLASLTGLRPLIEALQDIVDRYHELLLALDRPSPFGEWPPPLLWLLAGKLQTDLHTLAANPGENLPGWIEAGVFVPIIALTVRANDFQTEADSLFLEQFVTLGGLRIEDNRFHSANGQTVIVNVWPYGANVSVVIYLIRTLFNAFLEILNGLNLDELTTDLPGILQPLVAAIHRLFAALRRLLTTWQQQIEGSLTTDYRISGNSLHSLNTAIESNLFELAVTGNHISLSPRPLSNDALISLADAFARSPTLAAFESVTHEADVAAVDYRNDLHQSASTSADWHLSDSQTIERANFRFTANPAAGHCATDPIASVVNPSAASGIAGRPPGTMAWSRAGTELGQQLSAYDTAIGNRDLALARNLYLRLSSALRGLLNSHCIWVKAPGCRVTSNQMSVSGARASRILARGGIRLQGDEQINRVSFVLLILETLVPGLDPLLGLTETLIENNEIFGGAANGIDIFAVAGSKPKPSIEIAANRRGLGLQALFDLTIRGNQIRGLEGAGIYVDFATLAVNVQIENNRITECGDQESGREKLGRHGGIVLDNVALCRIRGNQLERCAPAGAILTGLVGLAFDENRLVHNTSSTDSAAAATSGAGAILQHVYGELHLCDNEFLENPTFGLEVRNPLRGGADPGLALLVLLARLHTGGAFENNPDAILTVQALVNSNLFRSTALDGRGKYRFNLILPDARLLVNANSAHASRPQTLGRISEARHLVVTNNLLDTPSSDLAPPLLIDLSRAATAIVTSNLATSTSPIRIVGSGGTILHKAHNQPPIP